MDFKKVVSERGQVYYFKNERKENCSPIEKTPPKRVKKIKPYIPPCVKKEEPKPEPKPEPPKPKSKQKRKKIAKTKRSKSPVKFKEE